MTTKDPTKTGMNRTGVATSPIHSKELIEGATAGMPQAAIDTTGIARVRLEYAREAEPLGTMPPPASLKGAVKTVKEALKGERANPLIDMLGERLAYERTGVRVYDALITKLEAGPALPGGPSPDDLRTIRDQELAHMQMLKSAIERLGADPTVMTPAADTILVTSSGVVKVIADPRTTMPQALRATLGLELVDVDSWDLLVDMVGRVGETEMAAEFQRAADQEEEHVARVRSWLTDLVAEEIGVAAQPPEAPPAAPPG